LNLVHTSSSPFKVSLVEPSDIQPSLINTSADINYSQLTSSNSQLGNLVVLESIYCVYYYYYVFFFNIIFI